MANKFPTRLLLPEEAEASGSTLNPDLQPLDPPGYGFASVLTATCQSSTQDLQEVLAKDLLEVLGMAKDLQFRNADPE